MPARALIIAIENYPRIVNFETTLPGTHDSAKKFLAWIRTSSKFGDIAAGDEAKRIVICSDDPGFPGRTHGANAQDVRDALAALWQAGRDRTEELFVFISGHGFLFKESEHARAADVLVAADFGQASVSGAFCLPLDAIQQQLRTAMGAGNHYYFVDACRNLVSSQDVDVGKLGVALPRSVQRDAEVFTLFSTSRLSIAPTASAFTDHLVAGLGGKGRAKRAVAGPPPKQRVVWAYLLAYIQGKMPGVDGPAGGTNPGVLWEEDLKSNTCVITIDNAGAGDTFKVTPRDSLLRPLREFEIAGPTGNWQQPPDDYFLAVAHPVNRVTPIDPAAAKPVDLYDDCTARFAMDAAGFETERAAGRGWSGAVAGTDAEIKSTLTVVAAQGSEITITNPATGETVKGGPQLLGQVVRPDAPIVVEVLDRERTLIARREITVPVGGHEEFDVRFAESELRRSIVQYFPSSPDAGVDFSESLLGAVTDPDLCVWLSIIAASRVLGPKRFEKLQHLPLQTFDDITPGQSALYVLAGFEDDTRQFRVGVGRPDAEHRWRPTTSHPKFPGLFELMVPVAPGGLLVSLSSDDRPAETLSSYALPNRATVLSLTGRSGRFRVHQLLLPIHSLERHLDPEVKDRLPRNPLRAVKFVSQSQRLLERRRSIQASLAPTGEWESALYGKWLDPMMAIVASYELIRQGNVQAVGTAVNNLTRFFGELPDAAALGKMMNPQAAIAPPSWPPMVIDGFTAFPEGTFDRIMPQNKLDYGGLWTTWRNAVAPAIAGTEKVRV